MYLQENSKILSGQAYGLSGFSSNFCLHRDQSPDMTFTGPGVEVRGRAQHRRAGVAGLPQLSWANNYSQQN